MAYGAKLNWLLKPTAHRSLHDISRGIIENSASAVEAAIVGGYNIEVDLQAARDGAPIVFHDAELMRLTGQPGAVKDRSLAELCQIPLTGSADRILSLAELLDRVRGRTGLLLEIKGEWNGDERFVRAIAEQLAAYRGPVAVMSFDPYVVGAFERLAPEIPRGLVACRFEKADWPGLSPFKRFAMRRLLTAAIAKPAFIAYDIRALPAAAPAIARKVFGLPLLTWTVRTEADKARAKAHADAMIFETIEP
ncbi:glycerophosphodiester phosphodiesterase family protein [Methyloligella sp. 2.7D]|uniref:glycerophosphodiester phosphodiesterase family protein n=1 Tax=unclassified Methyloligella TaxID=2625955 RepID=UPI00157DCD67|nr:glycerophosphodiester phosphodiesterase family protein [Methyloligella sp. GL2]QKP77417.1 glycerophosphodiester phosphodiesterase [Methyloligella sp. GL2]